MRSQGGCDPGPTPIQDNPVSYRVTLIRIAIGNKALDLGMAKLWSFYFSKLSRLIGRQLPDSRHGHKVCWFPSRDSKAILTPLDWKSVDTRQEIAVGLLSKTVHTTLRTFWTCIREGNISFSNTLGETLQTLSSHFIQRIYCTSISDRSKSQQYRRNCFYG